MRRLIAKIAASTSSASSPIDIEPRLVRMLYDRLEVYLVGLLEDANLQAMSHGSGRLHVNVNALKMVRRMRGERV